MLSLRSRFVAWLSLALVLLTGLTPVQGFVICVEADGCISIEVKNPSADCGSCEGHPSEGLPGESLAAGNTEPGCPCVDYLVPGFSDEQVVANRSQDFQVGHLVEPAVELCVTRPVQEATSERGPPPREPHVAQSLEHIRSVILLV